MEDTPVTDIDTQLPVPAPNKLSAPKGSLQSEILEIEEVPIPDPE